MKPRFESRLVSFGGGRGERTPSPCQLGRRKSLSPSRLLLRSRRKRECPQVVRQGDILTQTQSTRERAPAATIKLKVGQKSTYTRTFTSEDVSAFAKLSGDTGVHHMKPDSKGRKMVQGLLTATLPTKLGGDMNYIARDLVFQFLRPVFVGDTVTCEGVVRKVVPGKERLEVSISILCTNQEGKEVLRGSTEGIIRA